MEPNTPASPRQSKGKRRNAIGIRVAKAREYRGWQQKELLAELELVGWVMSQPDLSKLERGEREVTDFELYCLASVLQATLGYFFRDADGRMIQRLLNTSVRRVRRSKAAAETKKPTTLKLPLPEPLHRSRTMLQ